MLFKKKTILLLILLFISEIIPQSIDSTKQLILKKVNVDINIDGIIRLDLEYRRFCI